MSKAENEIMSAVKKDQPAGQEKENMDVSATLHNHAF